MDKESRETEIILFLRESSLRLEDKTQSMNTLLTFKEHLTDQYWHIINLCYLIIRVCRNMGFSEIVIRELVNAAATHDVGKLALPRSLFDGKEFKYDLQYEFVKDHAWVGYLLLVRFNCFKAWFAGGHHLGKNNGYGLKFYSPDSIPSWSSKHQMTKDIECSFIKPVITDYHEVCSFLHLFSILDFIEKMMNSRTRLKHKGNGKTPEEILRERYADWKRYVNAGLSICAEIKND